MTLRSVALSFATALAVAACGGGAAKEPDSPTAKASGEGARPSCEAIDHACDPYEDNPGVQKDCHDLGEARASTEEQCAAKKDACLAACPPKK